MSGTLSAGTVSIGVKSNTTGFGKSLHNSLIGEIGGIGKSLGEAIVAGSALVLGVGIKEAMDSEKINAQFAAGIKSTGNAAGLTIPHMDDLAASIAGYSGQSYASIGNAEKLLQTFTNIKNSGPNKIFDMATVSLADMSAKMGGDATTNAIKIGRALQDPIKGVMALTRVGVTFTQSQKDSIKAMVAHGDVVGAQMVILKELNKEFGGAAKAAGQTLPGQLNRSKVAFGELSKSVVETILPIVTPAIQGLAGTITKNTPAIKAFAKAFSEDLKNAITTLSPYLKTFGSWIVDHKPLVIGFGVAAMGVALAFKVYEGVMATVKVATASWAVVQGVATAAMWLYNGALKISWVETLALKAMYLGSAIATGAMTAAQWLLNTALIDNPIGAVVMAVAALAAGIIWVATKTTWFQTIWQYMSSSIATAIHWLWDGVLKPVFQLWLNAWMLLVGAIINGAADAFGWIPGIGPKLKAAQTWFNNFKDGVNNSLNGINKNIDIKFTSNYSVLQAQLLNLSNSATSLAAKGIGKPPGAATGMDNWRGGPLWVGENGKELLDLPAGSKVTTHSDSMKRANGGGGDTFNIYEAVSAMATAMQVSRRQAALGAV